MTVRVPDGIAVGEHSFEFLIWIKIESKHDAAVHHPGTVTVIVRLAVATRIPYGIDILDAKIEVVGIICGIYGV